MSTITVEGLSKEFKTDKSTVLALDDVTLEIPDGHFAMIVGGSGCGKSTLLNIIAGLDQPTTGTVEIDGKPVEAPGRERGMVFQSYTLFPWLRVRDNVEFGPSLQGVNAQERRQRADELLEEVGLSDFADAFPTQLSGGMQQRVAIARALANDPEVLLMDEPFGALDALTRSSAQRFLTDLWQQRRRTIVFVTHDIDEAIFLGDTVYVMSARPGRVRDVVAVDIPRPRTLESVTDPEFGRLKASILGMILETATPAEA